MRGIAGLFEGLDLGFDMGESRFKSAAPRRAGCSLGEDVFALELECLFLTLPVGTLE